MIRSLFSNTGAIFLRPSILGAALSGVGATRPLRDADQVASLRQTRGLLWSVEREKDHKYRDTKEIIDEDRINRWVCSSSISSLSQGTQTKPFVHGRMAYQHTHYFCTMTAQCPSQDKGACQGPLNNHRNFGFR